MATVLTSLQKEILEYVCNNVNAAETAKGVNDVWLKRPHTSLSVNEVESALEGLVLLDVLEKHSLARSTTVYRIARDPGAPCSRTR